MFGWCTFMKLMLMKNGCVELGVAVEVVERGLLDIAVEERNADDAFLVCRRIDVLAVDLEVLVRRLAGIARQRALGDRANIARSSGSMSGNQVGSA